MQKLPDHISTDQLAKYFASECTPDECTAIEQWRDEKPEHVELLVEYELLWKDLGIMHSDETSMEGVDVDQAWQNFKNSREESAPTVKMPTQFWLKIAASIVFVLGAFALINQLGKPEILLAQTENEKETILLADGSEVTLNEMSRLEYPEKFNADSRQVSMSGEAFFRVDHDPDQPFQVKIGSATVTVLGTEFNIKSSQNKDTVSVYVQSGKVRFAFADKELILEGGQKGILYQNNGELNRVATDPVGLDQYWRTGLLTFDGQTLPQVLNSLRQVFKVDIQLEGENINNCRLNATFENEELENIVEVIGLTLQLDVVREDQTIILTGEGCNAQ